MRKIILAVVAVMMISFAAKGEEHRITTSDGVELYFEVSGEGTPCLYLHGGPGSGSYWLKKFSGMMLEKHFRMVYLDQRGVGRSSVPADGNYSMSRMIEDFEQVRKDLGIDSWLLLGHSFGGLLEMGYVNAHDDKISGLIFINSTLSTRASLEDSWIPKAVELSGGVAPEGVFDKTKPCSRRLAIASALLDDDTRWRLFYASESSADMVDASYGDIKDWNNDGGNAMLALDDYWQDMRPLSFSVGQPVLFFYGRKDWAIGPEHYKGVGFPEMMLVGCDVGHFPFLEAKRELEDAIDAYCEKYGF